MVRFALRILLSAVMLMYVLPMIPGFHFVGQFWPDAVVYGLLLAVVAWVLSILIALFAVMTLGLGTIFIILGFWLIPAFQLALLSVWFPQHLVIDSFGTAIVAGLVMMLVNAVTHKFRSSVSR
jgi:uncharacterized membrane protein YvlD (DUF360 family)